MSEERNASLQQITDMGGLGPEPSADYRASLDMLDNVVRECIFISNSYGGISSPTSRHFYASVLFTQMLTKGVSLLMLAPYTPWASKQIEHWDYSSMTGVARTLIELRVAFYYLCTEECSDEEWNVRWNLFNLHDCTSRIRMFTAFGDEEQVAGFQAQAVELRERLVSNGFFAALDPKRHKKLLHGQTAYLSPLEEIAERASIDVKDFRWLYVLFSSHVHALPMSFYRIGGDNPDRGRGLPSAPEEGYSALCLSLSASLLVKTRDELHRLFEGLTAPSVERVPPVEENLLDPGLTIGYEHVFEASEDILLRSRRIDENTLSTIYIHRPSGAEVLRRVDLADGGVKLQSLDPFFWTFSLNGGPVTEGALDEAMAGLHAHRIDHHRREILFKSPDA